LLLGKLIFLWFLSQSNDCETKEEYDRSHKELIKFLSLNETMKVLGDKCVNAITNLQDNLRSKEYKLAGYMRLNITNCMDACTTSPVESNNNTLKHGPAAINAKMNLDNTMRRLLGGINNRFERRKKKAKRELYSTNYASCAPTKDHLIRKGQGLIDRHHDAHHYCKSVMMGPNQWFVWNWYGSDHEEIKSPLTLYLPGFLRVRELYINEVSGDKIFVTCTCGVRGRVGVPCECFFTIANSGKIESNDIIDIGMVDVRYLKLFNAHYGEDNHLGQLLYNAQQQCFTYENEGILVSEEFAMTLIGDDDHTYPKLGPNTTEEDLREATYVLGRTSTTRLDMEMYRNEEDEDDDVLENMPLSDLVPGRYETASLTLVASKMIEDIKASAVKEVEVTDETDVLPLDEEVLDIRKNWTVKLDEALKNGRGSKELIEKLDNHIQVGLDVFNEAIEEKWGKNGGGKNRLELYGTSGGSTGSNKRLRGNAG
jgi:hypothetical protein